MATAEHSGTVEWRTIAAAPDFEISTEGAVRRRVASQRSPVGFVLKQTLDNWGYCVVGVKVAGRRQTLRVNRVMATTFLGEPPTPKHHAAHWDGIKTNNRIANIRWATPKENVADGHRHGRRRCHMAPGEDHPNAVLTDALVARIRINAASGMSGSAIAAALHLNPVTVRNVIARRRWTHLP